MSNVSKITNLMGIKYPIIQAGMIWCSGWRLASASSNSGCLGLIGSGSMSAELLDEHIVKCRANTNLPFGVNVPLMYSHTPEIMDVIIKQKVKIVFTSAGNPETYTERLKSEGITVIHVVSNLKFARKAQNAGVDAIVAEGFEAGGHNGREETTTMALIPYLKKHISIPIIAAGGIFNGRSMLAAIALGADAVQIGSRFAVAEESSAHNLFKEEVIKAKDGDTKLVLKQLNPVRLLKSDFLNLVNEAEKIGKTKEEMSELLGRGRSKKGIFEGNLKEGELEIGQVSALIDKVQKANEIVVEIIKEYEEARLELFSL